MKLLVIHATPTLDIYQYLFSGYLEKWNFTPSVELSAKNGVQKVINNKKDHSA